MSASEITEEMFQQQKERMLASAKGTPKKRKEPESKEPTSEDEEGSAESVRSSSTMALRVYLEDEGGEEEEEEQAEDAPIEVEEDDLEKLRKMKAQSERPTRSESDKPALEKKEDKRLPLETTSKAMAKPKPKQTASGFTHGGYSITA